MKFQNVFYNMLNFNRSLLFSTRNNTNFIFYLQVSPALLLRGAASER